MSNNNGGNPFAYIVYLFFQIATAMIGHTIHNSVGWSIMDFFFAPFAWIKWLICKEVSLSIIEKTFAFLGN